MYRSINFNWEKKCFNGALKRFWWWFPCHIILCHSIQNEIHSDPRTSFIHTSKHSLHRSSVFLKSIIWYYRRFLIFLPNYTLFYVFYKSKKKPLTSSFIDHAERETWYKVIVQIYSTCYVKDSLGYRHSLIYIQQTGNKVNDVWFKGN